MRYRRRTATIHLSQIAGLLAAVLLLIAACNPFGPEQIYQTTSVGVAVSAGSGGATASVVTGGSGAAAARSIASAPQFAVVGAPDPANITLVTLTISGEDKFGVFQDPLATAVLTNVGGIWQATVDDLPIGPALTFAVEAFDAGGDALYSGSSTVVLGAAGETVSIDLYPVTDGTPVVFPIIQSITRPAEIIVDTSETVSVALSGTANEDLDVSFDSGGGTFTPNPAVVALSGSGTATLDALYGAPSVVGTYDHSVNVTNEQGNSVTTAFQTVVVYETGSVDVVIGIAPAIIGLSASRSGSDVSYTATVTDDKPLGELIYSWSIVQGGGTPGAAFVDPGANPGTLGGYDETVTGTVSITVTDGDGLSTTVTFDLPAGQFPDSLVVDGGGTTPPPFGLPGETDPAFGTNGIVGSTVLGPGRAVDVHEDAQGRLYVSGTDVVDPRQAAGTVTRLDTSGAIDTSFASAGTFLIDLPNAVTWVRDVVDDGSGGLFVVAFTNETGDGPEDTIVTRLDSTGQVDTSYGTAGQTVFDFGFTRLRAISAALDAAGGLIVAGFTGDAGANVYFVTRLLPDGQIDTAFGTNGLATISRGQNQELHEVFIDSAGRILITGVSLDATNSREFVTARFTAGGILDTTYGTNGVATTPPAVNAFAIGSAMDSSDRLIVVGQIRDAGGIASAAVARFLPNGSLDPSFDSDGIATYETSAPTDYAIAATVADDGKIVFTVLTEEASGEGDLLVGRANADGTLDTAFGTGGFATVDIDLADIGWDVIIDSFDRIVVAGQTIASDGSASQFAVRLFP